MKQKNIIEYEKKYEIKKHPSIKGIEIIKGKNNFPINWLNQQEYCEYQIYLEHIKCIKTQTTPSITQGSKIHEQLDDIFKQASTPISFENAVESSKKEASMSREVFVISPDYGIRGHIDEIWMKPDEIMVIKDEPGRTPYDSAMNHVRASGLAYKDMAGDSRKIKCALRERGSENLFWIEVFSKEVENQIKNTVNRMHELLDELKPFVPTKNPNKCKSCRFKNNCKHSLI